MRARNPLRKNNDAPKVTNHADVSDTETKFDLCDSNDDPEASSPESSDKNACVVEKGDDFSATLWWISPEDDEGFNSLQRTESEESQRETVFKEFLGPSNCINILPFLEDRSYRSFIVDVVKTA